MKNEGRQKGRPKSRNAKSKQIVVRVTPVLYNTIEVIAERNYISMSELIREVLIKEFGDDTE